MLTINLFKKNELGSPTQVSMTQNNIISSSDADNSALERSRELEKLNEELKELNA